MKLVKTWEDEVTDLIHEKTGGEARAVIEFHLEKLALALAYVIKVSPELDADTYLDHACSTIKKLVAVELLDDDEFGTLKRKVDSGKNAEK